MEMIDRGLLKNTCRASVVTFILGSLVLCRIKFPGIIWVCAAASIPAAAAWTKLVSYIFDRISEKSFVWRMSQEVNVKECEPEKDDHEKKHL